MTSHFELAACARASPIPNDLREPISSVLLCLHTRTDVMAAGFNSVGVSESISLFTIGVLFSGRFKVDLNFQPNNWKQQSLWRYIQGWSPGAGQRSFNSFYISNPHYPAFLHRMHSSYSVLPREERKRERERLSTQKPRFHPWAAPALAQAARQNGLKNKIDIWTKHF